MPAALSIEPITGSVPGTSEPSASSSTKHTYARFSPLDSHTVTESGKLGIFSMFCDSNSLSLSFLVQCAFCLLSFLRSLRFSLLTSLCCLSLISMEEKKAAARRIKRPLLDFGGCASPEPEVVEPLPKSEKTRDFLDLLAKRQRRFRKSSTAVDLPPSSTAGDLPPSSTAVDLNPSPSCTVDNLPSIGDTATVEKVTPLATSNESQGATIEEAEHPSEMDLDQLRLRAARCLIRKYKQEVDSRDTAVSKLCALAEDEKRMILSLLSREELAANDSSLMDADISGLDQVATDKETLESAKIHSESVLRSLLNILRTHPVIPVDCLSDFKVVELLRDKYKWNGEVRLSESVEKEMFGIRQCDVDCPVDKEEDQSNL